MTGLFQRHLITTTLEHFPLWLEERYHSLNCQKLALGRQGNSFCCFHLRSSSSFQVWVKHRKAWPSLNCQICFPKPFACPWAAMIRLVALAMMALQTQTIAISFASGQSNQQLLHFHVGSLLAGSYVQVIVEAIAESDCCKSAAVTARVAKTSVALAATVREAPPESITWHTAITVAVAATASTIVLAIVAFAFAIIDSTRNCSATTIVVVAFATMRRRFGSWPVDLAITAATTAAAASLQNKSSRMSRFEGLTS